MSVQEIIAELPKLEPEEFRLVREKVRELEAVERPPATAQPAREHSLFERLQSLSVNDPASPTDLATNPAHMEGLGVSRFA